jgi:hypothetical protein
MNDLDFCKARLEVLVEHTASPNKLAPNVEKFMKDQYPPGAGTSRQSEAWAQRELATLESTPASVRLKQPITGVEI